MKKVHEKKTEYEFFLRSTQKAPPSHLSETIKNRMKDYINPSSEKIIFKYIFGFVMAGLISLFLCPQKGLGFMEDNYPLFFHILHSNKFLCGLYCGTFFFLMTHASTLLSLSHYERIGFFKKLWILPHGLFSVFFGVFMFVSEDIYNFNVAYNLSWMLAILIGLWSTKFLFKRYNNKVLNSYLSR